MGCTHDPKPRDLILARSSSTAKRRGKRWKEPKMRKDESKKLPPKASLLPPLRTTLTPSGVTMPSAMASFSSSKARLNSFSSVSSGGGGERAMDGTVCSMRLDLYPARLTAVTVMLR